jgi:hypothetical protein
MSRPRKPTEELLRKPRKNENRGYEPSNLSNEIQKEILLQFNKIQASLQTVDPVKDIKAYKILVDTLLKIHNQCKTFSGIGGGDITELKTVIKNTSGGKEIKNNVDRLMNLFFANEDEDFRDIILLNIYRAVHEKKYQLTDKQNEDIGIHLKEFMGTQKHYLFKDQWENNKYKDLI